MRNKEIQIDVIMSEQATKNEKKDAHYFLDCQYKKTATGVFCEKFYQVGSILLECEDEQPAHQKSQFESKCWPLFGALINNMYGY